MIKKILATTAVLMALPVVSQAQTLQYPGFYVGAVGGVNWMLNNSFNASASTPGFVLSGQSYASMNTGWAAGGMVGYDFVGPRVELEGMYRDNTGSFGALGVDINQVSVMANVLYDFNAGGVIVPYIGAGAGVAFLNSGLLGASSSSTQFAYQAIVGVGYNIDPTFRINLEGRYYGTTSPNFNYSGNLGGTPFNVTGFAAEQQLQLDGEHPGPLRRAGRCAAAAAGSGCHAVLHGVLRLGPLEPVAAGADDDRPGGRFVQDQGQRPDHRDRPRRPLGSGELQHGAVSAPRECGQGCAGA